MHRILVGQGWVGAAEFWTLPPAQLWWIIEDKLPERARDSVESRSEMLRMLREARRREQSAGS